MFERAVYRHPDRVALVADGVRWTLRGLDRASTQLSRELRVHGAGTGVPVVCAMTRSVRAVIAQLAVGKVGAVHVPVDPAAPRARVAVVLHTGHPSLLVTDADHLAAQADIVLPADGRPATPAGPAVAPPPRNATGPAYILHTSGSTGRPKGVVVGHSSVVNLYQELAARMFPSDGASRRVAHGLPFSFDAAWNPLLWLVGGHEVHLVPEEIRTDPEQYVGFVRTHRIAVVEAVPTFLDAMVAAGLLDGDHRPEHLLMGGEAVGEPLWSRLRATTGLTATNLYGPTECTVFTTSCRLSDRELPAIGRPIGNTGVAVVDADLRPVPAGEPGELLVSGACLALAYHDLPELTAARFVTTGRRAYRTGDRCRLAPDGNVEWLGRLDDQVKIRGHRVEPGEIEHALRALTGVRQAAVRAHGDGATTRLAAYVVLDQGCGPDTAADIRGRLAAGLPDHLVPAEVVPLAALPLDAHGKVDRSALAPPGRAMANPRSATGGEPLSPAQEVVAELFRTLLGVGTVDAHSDFTALGGHSLTAAALADQLRGRGARCSLRDVLRLRTVARLAELVPVPTERSTAL
ncbi:non-ribosomal peptide synthetase [Actinophytocola glycyrrhizae]|uniref:Amino acid adenylation domain-containing protein n=1 Tax=Actinophytocola glycyrrhizae TaxID=2044873 RepID=A0ABV9S371_9PSEU